MHFSTLLAIVRVALLRSSRLSCFMRPALFITWDQFVSCVYFFFLTSLFIHLHRQKSKGVRSVSVKFKQLYPHTHWKLDTCLYELIYSEQSILSPPKIFTIPPETPCICWRKTGSVPYSSPMFIFYVKELKNLLFTTQSESLLINQSYMSFISHRKRMYSQGRDTEARHSKTQNSDSIYSCRTTQRHFQ